MTEVSRPFRWDLVRPDQLGTLLDDAPAPDLWFADELLRCAARALSQSGDGDLYLVGRSVDSLFDLLGGALADTSWRGRARQLPLSLFRGDGADLTAAEVRQLRSYLAAQGLTPEELMRGRRPVVFVDLVAAGSTSATCTARCGPGSAPPARSGT